MKFDKYANKYDKGWQGKASSRFYNNLINELNFNEGDSVLDVGCGTGKILNHISNNVSANYYGIDESVKMIEEARKKNKNIDFKVGDVSNLPYKDSSMDLIMACMAYHHFPNQEKFREEASRVLKTGGKIYICDPRLPKIIRFIFNHHFKDSGFYSSKKNIKVFEESGFKLIKVVKDFYVQLLVFEKI